MSVGGKLPLGMKVGSRSKATKKVRCTTCMLLMGGIVACGSLIIVMIMTTTTHEGKQDLPSIRQPASQESAESLSSKAQQKTTRRSTLQANQNDKHSNKKKKKNSDQNANANANDSTSSGSDSRTILLPPAPPAGDPKKSEKTKKRAGFMVLGMHRSGTSMLAGIMIQGMGYHVGSPLIGAGPGNEKGHFELLPVVLQNDQFMNKQKVWWGANIMDYNVAKAAEMRASGEVAFSQGAKALAFLNDAKSIPWLQKDPRMCLTIHTWLPLLRSEPAIVFTYRHPLEVAQSLAKRNGKQVVNGLRLWMGYNIRAIQNTVGMCRVFSSNDAILANPQREVQRIADELTHKCGVPPPPRPQLPQSTVDDFVDLKLQHNKQQRQPQKQQAVLETTQDGCEIPDYTSDKPPNSLPWQRERKFYLMAMRMHCDLQSGKAYQQSYKWPKPF